MYLDAINRAYHGETYYPIVTEAVGIELLTVGSVGLIVGGYMKVAELCTGQKQGIPNIAVNASNFMIETGKVALIEGIKRVLPTAAIATAVYIALSSAEVL